MSSREDITIMFENAGLAFCYEKMYGQYSVVDVMTGKEEISTHDALNAWAYYIQRVDIIVRRRISAAMQKHSASWNPTREDLNSG